MKNFKFRAFYNGEMHYSDQAIEYKNCKFFPMKYHKGVEQKDVILMQFSGEYDSKHNELYEDDILELHYPSGKALTGLITFEKGEFLFNGTSLHKIVKAFKTEVYFNIHTNPELK